MQILCVARFRGMGTPVQLRKRFGGPEQFAQAVQELQDILYQKTAT